MHPLAFTCPKTGWPIDCGLEVGINRSRLRDVQPVTLRIVCPHCNKPHVWKLADGYIREPRPQPPLGDWRAM